MSDNLIMKCSITTMLNNLKTVNLSTGCVLTCPFCEDKNVQQGYYLKYFSCKPCFNKRMKLTQWNLNWKK